jgi:hypothetical protein
MRCPACKQPITETTDACACGFSLPALDQFLGMVPVLGHGLNDLTATLSRGEGRGINRRMDELERRFPQLQFAVVLCSPPSPVPLNLYAFWLFNKSGLTSAVERGGKNRLVLLAIDPDDERLVTMIGYGLEPFIAEHRLTNALSIAGYTIPKHGLLAGIMGYLAHLELEMIEASRWLDQGFGIGQPSYVSLDQIADCERQAMTTY